MRKGIVMGIPNGMGKSCGVRIADIGKTIMVVIRTRIVRGERMKHLIRMTFVASESGRKVTGMNDEKFKKAESAIKAWLDSQPKDGDKE